MRMRSSFAIEGERPSGARAARWAEAIGQAGTQRLTLPELERLQRLVIGDARFVRLGLRSEGGFVGTHDRRTREPLPEHVSARAQYLPDLVAGVKEVVEMPDRQVELLRGFLQQGGGRLSKRARDQEFAALTDAEAERVEGLYARCFEP
jgi:hypothetical protein